MGKEKITTLEVASSRSQSKKSIFKTPTSQNQNASPLSLKAVSDFQDSQQHFVFWKVKTGSELGKTAYITGASRAAFHLHTSCS